jgi:hypothetical protein
MDDVGAGAPTPKEKLPKEGGNKGKMAASSRRYTARLGFVAEG